MDGSFVSDRCVDNLAYLAQNGNGLRELGSQRVPGLRREPAGAGRAGLPGPAARLGGVPDAHRPPPTPTRASSCASTGMVHLLFELAGIPYVPVAAGTVQRQRQVARTLNSPVCARSPERRSPAPPPRSRPNMATPAQAGSAPITVGARASVAGHRAPTLPAAGSGPRCRALRQRTGTRQEAHAGPLRPSARRDRGIRAGLGPGSPASQAYGGSADDGPGWARRSARRRRPRGSSQEKTAGARPAVARRAAAMAQRVPDAAAGRRPEPLARRAGTACRRTAGGGVTGVRAPVASLRGAPDALGFLVQPHAVSWDQGTQPRASTMD